MLICTRRRVCCLPSFYLLQMWDCIFHEKARQSRFKVILVHSGWLHRQDLSISYRVCHRIKSWSLQSQFFNPIVTQLIKTEYASFHNGKVLMKGYSAQDKWGYPLVDRLVFLGTPPLGIGARILCQYASVWIQISVRCISRFGQLLTAGVLPPLSQEHPSSSQHWSITSPF